MKDFTVIESDSLVDLIEKHIGVFGKDGELQSMRKVVITLEAGEPVIIDVSLYPPENAEISGFIDTVLTYKLVKTE